MYLIIFLIVGASATTWEPNVTFEGVDVNGPFTMHPYKIHALYTYDGYSVECSARFSFTDIFNRRIDYGTLKISNLPIKPLFMFDNDEYPIATLTLGTSQSTIFNTLNHDNITFSMIGLTGLLTGDYIAYIMYDPTKDFYANNPA